MRPILLVLACALLASCGAQDTTDTYSERGNELCREALERVRELPQPRSLDEIADYFEQLSDISAETSDEIAALEPPEGLEAVHERAVRESERGDRLLRALTERLRAAPNPQAVLQREIEKLMPSIRRAERLNRKLGLEDCNETDLPGGEPEPS